MQPLKKNETPQNFNEVTQIKKKTIIRSFVFITFYDQEQFLYKA